MEPNNIKKIILEIRAGAGGDEASLFAGDLMRMYQKYAIKYGWGFSILDASESGAGGYKTVVAFHTRNPIHRSHEFLQRCALEFADALFINPVIGKKKSGDFNEKYIINSYDIMNKKFYPKEKIIFSTLSTYSRYAGPREAVFTALVRRNFGATHFIVGRDHTGVGDFYGKYDSQKIFDKLGNIGIEILKFHAPFYCKVCKQYVTEHTCAHDEDRIDISGTKIREMLKNKIPLPEEVMRPEITAMIIEAIKNGEEVFVK